MGVPVYRTASTVPQYTDMSVYHYTPMGYPISCALQCLERHVSVKMVLSLVVTEILTKGLLWLQVFPHNQVSQYVKLDFEQSHEKTNNLHMRKQRRRSASQ